MYFPYMRGKQNELSALIEVITGLQIDKVQPVIEPVNRSTKPLINAINALNSGEIIPHIIVNPEVGQLASDYPDHLYSLLSQENVRFVPCIRLHNQNITSVNIFLNKLISHELKFSLILQEDIIPSNASSVISKAIANLIIDQSRYSNQFTNSLPNCVIISSSFPAKDKNANYSSMSQFFSDAHTTYNLPLVRNQIGFGDYLIISNVWSTKGGPAYVVALHITYIEKSNSNMYVKHSLSVTNPNNQSDTAGKFQEALDTMIQFANQTPSLDQNTLGFQQYINLHNINHFPGLGIPKKLSMMHHIETISNCL
ncbi:sce7725 family protein [Psychrobacter sp. 1176_08]|uniref:sce7725 family protein n=1 Tax=Psychrobacter sp. 1176_08 TaxID=2604452 RepID=UPI0040646E29